MEFCLLDIAEIMSMSKGFQEFNKNILVTGFLEEHITGYWLSNYIVAIRVPQGTSSLDYDFSNFNTYT